MFASSACAVQMFEVAFSRLMCCSRVCSDMRYADDAARQVPDVLVFHRKEGCVRSAETKRHTEALRIAEYHVSAHFTRRREERERQQICRDGHQHTGLVGARDEAAQIGDSAALIGKLHQRSKHSCIKGHLIDGAYSQLDAQWLGTTAQHFDGFRKAPIGHEKGAGILAELFELHTM